MHLTESDKQRFWNKVAVKSKNECWKWIGYKPTKYGNMSVNNKGENVQRISYFLEYGQFDESLDVCHSCDEPTCVNPKHLFIGTRKDNMQDMASKDRGTKFSDKSDIILAAELHYQEGLTYQEISDNLGCSKQTVYAWLNFRSRKLALSEDESKYIKNLKEESEIKAKALIEKCFELKSKGYANSSICKLMNVEYATLMAWLKGINFKNITIPLKQEFGL